MVCGQWWIGRPIPRLPRTAEDPATPGPRPGEWPAGAAKAQPQLVNKRPAHGGISAAVAGGWVPGGAPTGPIAWDGMSLCRGTGNG